MEVENQAPTFNEVEQFIPENLQEYPLWPKLTELMKYILDNGIEEMKDFREKYTGPDQVSEDVVKEILIEQGFSYIVDIMDTITDFEFNTLITYVSLISQLKGNRKGLELVLRLLGFESVIREWWEDPDALGEPWTYELTVLANASNVPDIFTTLQKVEIFSRNYVFAQISNIDIQFILENFAEAVPIAGGYIKPKYFGRIIQRANP
jgi:hypothetical protein